MYSWKSAEGEKKVAKGIVQYVKEKNIHHEQYRECLQQQKQFTHSMYRFKADLHQVYLMLQTKKSLSPFDDKRYILDCGVKTRAHGYQEEEEDLSEQFSQL